jgi:hypothetical protein
VFFQAGEPGMRQRSDIESIARIKQEIARDLRGGLVIGNVIWNMACLGRIRHHQGEHVKAHQIFRRAVELCSRVEALCPRTLAFLLDAQGRLLQEMAHMLLKSL